MKKLAVALLALLFALPASADAIGDTRAAYLAIIDRPQVPPKAGLSELAPVEGLRKFHFWFSSDAAERVPPTGCSCWSRRTRRTA